jgi:hypothetical protein
MRVHWPALTPTALLITIAGSTALADTAIATRWKPMGEAQNDCMAHAQMAIWRAGFDKADPGSQTMSGKRGEYTASIRCLSEQRIVFFVTSGPSAEATARYMEALFGHF